MLDMRNSHGYVQAGHIYFHPSERKPPIPLTEALADAHPELPIVIVEVPHLVLARFLLRCSSNVDNGEDEVAVDEDGRAIILLFTAATDQHGRSFDPSTHFKMGKQHNGVKIFD